MRELKSSVFRGIAILFLLIAATLFCIAMVETAYITTQQPIQGFWIFLTGWMGFLMFQFAWYANPLTALSLLLLRKHPWWALLSSALALLCMSQAFFFYEIPIDTSGQTIPIVARGLGFYCWVASTICTFYAVIMLLVYRSFKHRTVTLRSPDTVASDQTNATPAFTSSNEVAKLSVPPTLISTRSNP